VPSIPNAPLQMIFSQLRSRTGHDFSCYKASTIRRRIERRMNVHQLARPDDYVRYLRENPREVDLLFKELLIGVTSFFRDAEAFDALAAGPLADLVASRPENSTLRGWVPGCATGEEVFSIAILLRECMERQGKHLEVQLFGTDLDADAIETARIGKYPMGIAADITPERLERYIYHDDHIYSVSKEIRSMAVFAIQNVIKDPPFTKLDLISCRNLLIYLNGEIQHRLLGLFHYALKPGGLLWLGPSETIGSSTDLFETLDKRWKVFRRLETGAALQRLPDIPAEPRKLDLHSDRPAAPLERPPQLHIARLLERMLLARFAPPSVVVNEHGDVVYIHGRTGAYLEPSPGLPKSNILEMARPGLEFELRAALREAAAGGDEVVCEDVLVKTNGEHMAVNVSVSKIREPESIRGLLLVTFRPTPAPKSADAYESGRAGRRRKEPTTREKRLERELQHAKESLRWTVEELEVSNEELRAANEELQSTNEELQSTNEELETSREELQSLNEELTTVNSELELKMNALSQSSGDMQNLLNNTNIATIFLDEDLHIRRFTEPAKKLVKLIETDVGRPLGDLTIDLQYEHLLDDCRSVLRSLRHLEREVQDTSGVWYMMRILPYRTTENIVTGLVLTFVDIDRVKTAEATAQQVQWVSEFFESIVNTIRHPLLVLDADLYVIAANTAFHMAFQTRPEEVVHRRIYELGEHQWDIPRFRQLLEEILPQSASFEGFRIEHEFPKVGRKVLLLNGRRLERKASMEGMILLSMVEDGGDA
jgi:two-component system, chemotaxis family, CheB/CheR fusion protein